MKKNLLVRFALPCHIIGAVLTHSDLMSAALDLKGERAVFISKSENRTVKGKDFSDFGAREAFGADSGFQNISAFVFVRDSEPVFAVVRKRFDSRRFRFFFELLFGERHRLIEIGRKLIAVGFDAFEIRDVFAPYGLGALCPAGGKRMVAGHDRLVVVGQEFA